MNVLTFDFFWKRKLTGRCKILFNLGNKFHRFYTSMINGAINVLTTICLLEGGGGRGLLKTFIDNENEMDIECPGQIDNENLIHFYSYFFYIL